MKSLLEFIFEQNHAKGLDKIFEMSLISDKTDQLPNNTEIYVYGENDLQGTKTPHFHVIIDKGKFEFEIAFDHFHDLEIWRSKTNKYDWSGYKNVKKAIKRWLMQKNADNTYKNIEMILNEWNRRNDTNEIDKQKYINLYDKLKNKV